MQKTYKIQGMDCAHCAEELEEGVGRLSGVNHVQVDFVTAKMTIEGNVPLPLLKQRVEALGKKIADSDESVEAGLRPAPTQGGTGILAFIQYLLGETETP